MSRTSQTSKRIETEGSISGGRKALTRDGAWNTERMKEA